MLRRLGVSIASAAFAAVTGGAMAAPALADDLTVMRINLSGPPMVEAEYDPLAEEELFSGRYDGVVDAAEGDLFADTDVACEFNGYAAEGRAFSCGFTTVETVTGRCLFTADNGDSAVAEWRCRTGAMMTSDARCEGRMTWIDGTGRFAGITGDAKMHSDLFLQPGKGYIYMKGDWTIPSLALAIQ